MGGAIFHFSHKIGLKSTKSMRFCILYKPMGELEIPRPPPGYATEQGGVFWCLNSAFFNLDTFFVKKDCKTVYKKGAAGL